VCDCIELTNEVQSFADDRLQSLGFLLLPSIVVPTLLAHDVGRMVKVRADLGDEHTWCCQGHLKIFERYTIPIFNVRQLLMVLLF
jgi:hypothetical protein